METHIPVLFLDLSGTLFLTVVCAQNVAKSDVWLNLLSFVCFPLQLMISSPVFQPHWPVGWMHYLAGRRRTTSLTFILLNTTIRRYGDD